MVGGILLWALLLAGPEVTVDLPDTVQVGDVFVCKVTVSGGNIDDIDCTPVYSDGLQHLATGSMRSISTVSTPSGTRTNSTVALTMSFTSYTAGEQTIGPMNVYSSGHLIATTEQYTVTSVGEDMVPDHDAGNSSYSGGESPDGRIAWMEVQIDTTGRVYPGQTFQANYYICKTQPGAEVVDLFLEPSDYATSTLADDIDQLQWVRDKTGNYRTWIATLDITPAFACTLSLPLLRGRVGIPGGMLRPGREQYISTEGTSIPVYPFPDSHKPDNFTGITGRIEFHSEAVTGGYSAGGEKCVLITASGEGSSQLDQLPELPVAGPANLLPGRFCQTDSDERAWHVLVEPTDSGTVIVGPDSIGWFDTDSETYRQAVIPACTLSVYPIIGSSADLSVLDDHEKNSTIFWLIAAGLLLLAAILLILRFRSRIAAPVDIMAAGDVEELLTALGDRLSLILTGSRGYIGSEELDELLDKSPVDVIVARRLLRHWKDLELLLSSRKANPEQLENLKKKSSELLKTVADSVSGSHQV